MKQKIDKISDAEALKLWATLERMRNQLRRQFPGISVSVQAKPPGHCWWRARHLVSGASRRKSVRRAKR